MATLDRAITVAKRILDANKVKDKALFKQHVSEIIFLLQTVNEQTTSDSFDYEKVEIQEDILRKVQGGEKTAQFSYFLFLKAKRMMMSGVAPEETLEAINKALEIQEELEKASPKQSAQLGRYYYFQGTVYQGLEKLAEKQTSFKKAYEILQNYPEFQELTQELKFHIENGEVENQEEVEETNEPKSQAHEENSLGQLVAIASVGALAVGAIVYAVLKLRRS